MKVALTEPIKGNMQTGSVKLFRLLLTYFLGGDYMAKDPVCKMDVNEKTAKLKSDYNGKTYYFCNASCKTTFDKNPSKYVK